MAAAKKVPAKRPPRKRAPVKPATLEPIRPLAGPGRDAWQRIAVADAGWISEQIDLELLQMVCEQVDERAALRIDVLRNGDWRDRNALRALDQQILTGLSLLGLTPSDRSRIGLQSKVTPSDDLAQVIARLSSPVRNRTKPAAGNAGPAGS